MKTFSVILQLFAIGIIFLIAIETNSSLTSRLAKVKGGPLLRWAHMAVEFSAYFVIDTGHL